mmetsp:Transcript_54754/g.127784  ORF Transcript_54754/g.127784 Transcript_54754/m.127784 type:complete len:102 (+) Transcript_54754:497-802(+)
MDESNLLALVLPHLYARAREAGLPHEETAQVLSILEMRLAAAPVCAGSEINAAQCTRANSVLKKLTFIRLVRLATYRAGQDIEESLVLLQKATGFAGLRLA